MDGRLRKGEAANTFEARESDRGTTAAVGASFGSAMIAAPLLALWRGYGLALTSAPALLVTTVPNLVAYLRRMDAEEAMLAESLGEAYLAYQQRTRRLVPGLY